MLTYLKLLLLSLFSGFFAALPVSYSAHYAFLNSVMNFTQDDAQLGFYFSVISSAFALAVVIKLRRMYGKAFRLPLTSSKKLSDPSLKKAGRKALLGLLISLLPAAVMWIPLPNGRGYLMDIFVLLLKKDYLLVPAFCCVFCGLFLLLALWYTKQHYDRPRRASTPLSVFRFAVYQIPSYLFPGISHTATGAASLLLTDVDSTVIVRETLLYLAPSMLVINVSRVVRYVLAGVTLHPVLLAICVTATLLSAFLVLSVISKFNLRNRYLFFALYSLLFGLVIAGSSFLM